MRERTVRTCLLYFILILKASGADGTYNMNDRRLIVIDIGKRRRENGYISAPIVVLLLLLLFFFITLYFVAHGCELLCTSTS